MEDEPRACNPAYGSMTNDELLNCVERRLGRGPIDMDALECALYAAGGMLRRFISAGTENDVAIARERLIGHLYCFDSVCEDLRQQTALPRAEDGDVIFCNRSWAPGRLPESLGKAMILASQEARKQREAVLERAGLSRRGSAA